MAIRIVFKTDGYGPWITEGPQGLSYDMPVESGIVSFEMRFPISQADANIVMSDRQRAALLYGALHHPSQLAETRLSPLQVEEYFRLILHAPLANVAAFLNERNRQSRNAIYHLARSLSELDPCFA